MAPKKRTASASAANVEAQKAKTSKEVDASVTMELDVGAVPYSCLCTCDPVAADDWATQVLKSTSLSDSGSAPAAVLGMDCEWAAPWYRGPGVPDRLATLQLFHHGAQGRRALVFGLVSLQGKLPPALTSLLGDVRVAKVGANLAGDATRVVRDFGCAVRGVFDLCMLGKKPGTKVKRSVSLEAVVKANCPEEMHLSKAGADVRTSNWEIWPLTKDQVLYASRDAALSLMAFTCKFGMSGTSSPELTKEAMDALVDLASVEANSLEDGTVVQADSAEGQQLNKVMKKPAASGTAPVAEDEKKADFGNFFQHMRNQNVKPPNLGKKAHPKGPGDALANVCVVVSGTLDSFERSDMETYVQEHGGKVSKSVTAKVTHLVTDHGEAGPSKLAKCKELGIPVVSEDVILKMVADCSGATAPAAQDSAVSTSSKKRPRSSETGDTEATAKRKCVRSKQCMAADEAPIATTGGEAKLTAEEGKDVTKKKPKTKGTVAKSVATTAGSPESAVPAQAHVEEAIEKKRGPSQESKKASKDKPTQNAAEDSNANVAVTETVKGKDVTKPAAKRSLTPRARGSKKHDAEEIVESSPAKMGADTSTKEACTPAMKKGKESKNKDDTELATKRPSTPRAKASPSTPRAKASKKREAEEMAQPIEAPMAADACTTEIQTPAKKRGKSKDDTELATKRSLTPRVRASRKHETQEVAQPTEAATSTDSVAKDIDTPVTKKGKSKGDAEQAPKRSLTPRARASKKHDAQEAVKPTKATSADEGSTKTSKDVDKSVTSKSKDNTERAAKRSLTPRAKAPKKSDAQEVVQPIRATVGEEGSAKASEVAETPITKRGKTKDDTENAIKRSTTPKTRASKKPEAQDSANTSLDVDTPVTKKGRRNHSIDAESGPTPSQKAPKSVTGPVELDAKTLQKAEKLSLQSALKNLAGRVELQGKGFSAAKLLAALEKTNGLVNPAKHMLLGI